MASQSSSEMKASRTDDDDANRKRPKNSMSAVPKKRSIFFFGLIIALLIDCGSFSHSGLWAIDRGPRVAFSFRFVSQPLRPFVGCSFYSFQDSFCLLSLLFPFLFPLCWVYYPDHQRKREREASLNGQTTQPKHASVSATRRSATHKKRFFLFCVLFLFYPSCFVFSPQKFPPTVLFPGTTRHK